MSELPAWAHCETDEEEIARTVKRYAETPALARIVAMDTVYILKDGLDLLPRWRLIQRWRLTRAAKKLAKEHNLVG